MAVIAIIPRGPAQANSTAQAGSKAKSSKDMEKTASPFAEMLAMFFPVQMQGLQENHSEAADPADCETQKSQEDIQAITGFSAMADGSNRFIFEAMSGAAVYAEGVDEALENAEAGAKAAQQEANKADIPANVESPIDMTGVENLADVSGVWISAGAKDATTTIAEAKRTVAIPETKNTAVDNKIHNFAAKAAAFETTVQYPAEQGSEIQGNASAAIADYQPQTAFKPETAHLHSNHIETGLVTKQQSASFHKEQPDVDTGQPAYTQIAAERESTAKALSGDRQEITGRFAGKDEQLANRFGSSTFMLQSMQQAREQDQFHIQTEQMVQNEESIGRSIIEQMIDKLMLSYEDNKKELTVQLKPDTLGTVIIKLLEDKGITAAKIITSVPEARDLISSQISALKQQLADQGLSFHELDVVHAGSSFLQKQADSGSNPHQRSNPGYTWLPTVRTSGESSTEQTGSLELQRMLQAGRINYLV